MRVEKIMLKTSNILILILLIASAFGLFQIKYKVRSLKKEVIEISKFVQREREDLHILKAEWAFLNEPERLKKLVQQHLDLSEIRVSQIKEIKANNNLQINSESQNMHENIIKISYKPKTVRQIKWNYKNNKNSID
jgi:cell division protein FtsL